MSKVKCEYCGAMIDDTLDRCPNCGASNKYVVRVTVDTPRTIEELRQWYKDRNLPPEDITRFFVGKNIQEPKAFGIYKDGDNFVVYKNKANGQRAIRYEGTDEAYAVNELYMRLKDEILNQKMHNRKAYGETRYQSLEGGYGNEKGLKNNDDDIKLFVFKALAFFVLFFFLTIGSFSKPSNGHYLYNDRLYLYVNNNWYVHDSDCWTSVGSHRNINGTEYDDLHDNFRDYYVKNGVYSAVDENGEWHQWNTWDTYESDWYRDQVGGHHGSGSDYDSDYDWDSSDSWDSSDTDWDSNW